MDALGRKPSESRCWSWSGIGTNQVECSRGQGLDRALALYMNREQINKLKLKGKGFRRRIQEKIAYVIIETMWEICSKRKLS